MLHCNIRGFRTHRLELEGFLNGMPKKPEIVLLNETFLDITVGEPKLASYEIIARRDRGNGHDGCGGGVLVFAHTDVAGSICQAAASTGIVRMIFLVCYFSS